MRLPEYTEQRYRRLRATLWPLRALVCAWALWGIWVQMEAIDRPLEPTGSAIGDVALGTVNGLLIGVSIINCVIVATFVWHPLPKPERTSR